MDLRYGERPKPCKGELKRLKTRLTCNKLGKEGGSVDNNKQTVGRDRNQEEEVGYVIKASK